MGNEIAVFHKRKKKKKGRKKILGHVLEKNFIAWIKDLLV